MLVTNNASDFRRLYATQPLHAGLVIIIPTVNRATQRQLFHGALDEMARFGEPINRVLEVDIDREDVTFNLYDLTDPGSSISSMETQLSQEIVRTVADYKLPRTHRRWKIVKSQVCSRRS